MKQTSPLGSRLRELRLAAGFSQEDLAERAGLTPAAIGALERGERRRPYPHTIQSLADGLMLIGNEREEFVALASGAAIEPHFPSSSGTGAHQPPPSPMAVIVGREEETVLIAALLQQGRARLVTLTGPGGVGKSRLAIAVAQRLESVFPDAICWADLSLITAPSALPRALGIALGIGTAVEDLSQVRVAIAERDYSSRWTASNTSSKPQRMFLCCWRAAPRFRSW